MKTKNFISNIEKVKEKNILDLTAGQDLSIALMNLVSLEEHSFFSYLKTQDKKFLKTLESVREMRKKFLPLIVKEDDSETWCMSKHLLATSMRFYEVGNRYLHEGKKKEADEFYKAAGESYGLFWDLNSSKSENKIEISEKEEKSFFGSIKNMLKCCLE